MPLNILFLAYWLPFPPDNGSKLRIAGLLRGLARHHRITLLALTDSLPVTPDPELAQVCAAAYIRLRRPYRPNSLKALVGLFSTWPRSLVDTYDPDVAQLLAGLRRAQRYDLAIISELGMSSYLPALAGLPIILDDLEVGILHSQTRSAPAGWRRWRRHLPWLKLRVYLRRLLPRLAAVTVVSEPERALLRKLAPGYQAVTLLPNAIDVEQMRPNPALPRRPDRLIFTGSLRYEPNYDAMRWFVGDVLPRVQAHRPAVELLITGDHADRPLPPTPGVTRTGYVADVQALVQSAAVSVAPLRFGGGTRLKILEAMALGVPVVTTSLGAEGLAVQSGEHLLVADSAENQAATIIALLDNPARGTRLIERGRWLVVKQYSWQSLWPIWLELATHVAAAPTTASAAGSLA